MTRLTLLALLACPVWGQFHDLATTDDGGVVYFSTEHRRTGSSEPFQGRIYAVDSGGLRLVESRELTYPEPPRSGMLSLTNYYDLSWPSVSGDGRTFAFAGRRDCSGSNRCGGSEVLVESTIVGEGGETLLEGRLQLSANGRFGLVFDSGTIGFSPRIVDLQTGERRETYLWSPPEGGRRIADDGAVLLLSSGGLELLRLNGERTLIPLDEHLTGRGAIDGAARSAVFTSVLRDEPGTFGLRWIDLGTQELRTLAVGAGAILDPIPTREGDRVLFVSTLRPDDPTAVGAAHAFVVNSDGSGLRQLTTGDTGVQRATISGDGGTVYVVSGRGELLRIDVETGATAVLISRTLDLAGNYLSGVYGSLGFLDGAGFVAEAVGAANTPLPTELGGFRMRFAGIDVPLLNAAPDLVTFQTPWEYLPLANHNLVLPVEIEVAGIASPFVPAPIAIHLFAQGPVDFKLSQELAGPSDPSQPELSLVAHQDYGGLVTPADPAEPGEIVHAYLTGLGPVTNQPETGEPAPATEPLARLQRELVCELSGSEPEPAPVYYAGLAPGLVGVYQVSVGIPAGVRPAGERSDRLLIECRSTASALGASIAVALDSAP